MVCALVVIWPVPTSADEVTDQERAGEWAEDGMKFGEIVVRGDLVADAKVPGGWALVRTITNTSDAPQTATVEERIMRSESMVDARVDGTPVLASVTTRTFKLAPHEKKSLGISLPADLGREIGAGVTRRIAAEHARGEPGMQAVYDRTYQVFFVQYLRPLAPGETAPPPVVLAEHPARMPAAPPARETAGFDDSFSVAATGRAGGTK
jgi:hypothetical protein